MATIPSSTCSRTTVPPPSLLQYTVDNQLQQHKPESPQAPSSSQPQSPAGDQNFKPSQKGKDDDVVYLAIPKSEMGMGGGQKSFRTTTDNHHRKHQQLQQAEVTVTPEIKQEPQSTEGGFVADREKMVVLDPSIIPEGEGMIDG